MNPKLVFKLGMLLVARIMYGLQQWICLAVIARYGDAAGVGYFGLGLALVVPIMGFAGMGLRQGVATDVAALYSFRDYWIFRIVSLFVASAIVYGLAVGIHEEPVVLISVVSVLIPKAIELLSDLSYGYFQKAGDYDKISISLGVRAITGAVAFSIAFILTRSILSACLAWGAVWFLVFLVYDFPVARQAMQRDPQPVAVGRRAFSFLTFWKMLIEHFPLGLAGLIGNAGVSAPRMIYDRFTTPANLGIFTALTMAYQSVNLLFGTLLQNSLTPLSAAINARQPAVTAKLVRASAAATGAVSLLIVGMTFFAGNQLFGLVYGSRFAGYGLIASMLSIGWAARYVSTIFRYVATAERKFWTGIGLDTLCAAAIAIGCLGALLVSPSMISLSIGFTLGQLAALAVVLTYALVAIRRLNAA